MSIPTPQKTAKITVRAKCSQGISFPWLRHPSRIPCTSVTAVVSSKKLVSMKLSSKTTASAAYSRQTFLGTLRR